jgi:uncharacterized protein DUF4288
MTWFAAHTVMDVRFKDGRQDSYPVWENVLLIEATDGDDAYANAVARAQTDEGDSQGSMTWDSRPAEWVLAGIRKVISVTHHATGLGSGDEITYSEFLIQHRADLDRFVNGEQISVCYVE